MDATYAPFAVALAGIGPGIGIGLMAAAFFNSVARQPEVQGKLSGFFFITLGVVELLGLLGFVAFYMMLPKAG
jgi:F-type H+-transporting ATPase subunit c